MEDKLIRITQVMDSVSLCKTKIYELIKQEQFPAPRKPTPGCSLWVNSEIQDYIQCIKEGIEYKTGKRVNNVQRNVK